MPWARLDDALHTNRKVMKVSNDALAVWVCSVTYCSQNLSDGALSQTDVDGLIRLRDAPVSVTEELVAAGLWDEAEGGYTIHDYLEYNPSRAQVLADREGAKARRGRVPLIKEERNPNVTRTSSERNANVTRKTDYVRVTVIDPVPTPVLPVITNVITDKSASQQVATRLPHQTYWDAFVDAVGQSPDTPSERGKWNRGLKELRDAGIEEDELPELVAAYRRRFRLASCNPKAIANNLSEIRATPSVSDRPESLAEVEARLERERLNIGAEGGINPWSAAALAANPHFARMRTNGHSSARV